MFDHILWERSYPYLLAIGAAFLWCFLCIDLPIKKIDSILASSMTLGAILTGFLATSKTILIGLKGADIMVKLSESQYIDNLVSYLVEAIWSSFIFCLVCITGYFVKEGSFDYYEYAWIFFGVLAAACFIRVTRIIFLIIRNDTH
ncbi:MAG: hypothetical protein ACKVJF_09810 [Flavobacteriales bacterium]